MGLWLGIYWPLGLSNLSRVFRNPLPTSKHQQSRQCFIWGRNGYGTLINSPFPRERAQKFISSNSRSEPCRCWLERGGQRRQCCLFISFNIKNARNSSKNLSRVFDYVCCTSICIPTCMFSICLDYGNFKVNKGTTGFVHFCQFYQLRL